MTKLKPISRPSMPPSVVTIFFVIFLLTFSFETLRFTIPILPITYEEPLLSVMEKFITSIPLTYASTQVIVMLIVALCVDIIKLPSHIVLGLAILLWSCGPFVVSRCQIKICITWAINYMATMQGITQLLILSVGCQKYNQQEQFYEIYRYIMFAFSAYQIGLFLAQTFVPIDIIEHYHCKDIDCLKLLIGSTSVAACFVPWIYCRIMDDFAISRDGLVNDIKILSKKNLFIILYIILVFTPYLIFWKYYRDFVPEIALLPKAINLYLMGSNDFPRLFTALKVIAALLYYYLLYKWFGQSMIKYSVLLMTIGGILIGVWALISTSMKMKFNDQYAQVVPVKPDAIHITLGWLEVERIRDPIDFHIKVPFNDPILLNETWYSMPDIVYVVSKEDPCPMVRYGGFNFTYCFKPGHRYSFYLGDRCKMIIAPDRAVRDGSYGMPVFCAILTNAESCPIPAPYAYNKSGYDPDLTTEVQLTRYDADAEIEYIFNRNTNYYICQTVEPGTYKATFGYCHNLTEDLITLEYGGVYLLSCPSIHTIVKPFSSNIIDAITLMFSYLIRAIGDFLLITNGFYTIYINIHPTFRTTAIAVWFTLIKCSFIIHESIRLNSIGFSTPSTYNELFYFSAALISMPIVSLFIHRGSRIYLADN